MAAKKSSVPQPQSEPSDEQIAEAKQIEAPMLNASTLHIQGTGNDFILTFMRPRPMMSKGGFAQFAIGEAVAIVTVSPQTAKDISLALADAVRNHEKAYGEVITPFTLSKAQNGGSKKSH